MTQLSVCHVVNGLNRGFGGPSVSVSALASSLSACCGVGCAIVAQDHPERGPIVPSPGVKTLLVPPPRISMPWGYNAEIERYLNEAVEAARIVHSHGLWRYIYWLARRRARSEGKPLVLSPRGMLSPWALSQKRGRKGIALALFERRTLESCALIHASSAREAEEIRAFGLSQPIAVIANGVEAAARTGNGSRFRSRHGIPAGRLVLYLSRLHPGKGIEDLIAAWRSLGSSPETATLAIAGEGEPRYVEALRRTASGASNPIVFVGGAWGDDKEDAFAAADLFVLPSSSESFGIAVAEALSRGVPALATRETPWEILSAERIGWWFERAELASRLAEALATDSGALREMGKRGREIAAERMSWPAAARDMAAAYRWLLEGGDPPPFILVS